MSSWLVMKASLELGILSSYQTVTRPLDLNDRHDVSTGSVYQKENMSTEQECAAW